MALRIYGTRSTQISNGCKQVSGRSGMSCTRAAVSTSALQDDALSVHKYLESTDSPLSTNFADVM